MGDGSATWTRLHSTLLILKLSQDLWMTNHQLTLTSCGFEIWIQMLRFDSLCLKPLTTVPIFKQGWKTVIFWNSLASPSPPASLLSSFSIYQRFWGVSTAGLSCSSLQWSIRAAACSQPALPSCCAEASQYRSGLHWLMKQLSSQTAWSGHFLPSPWLALPLLFIFLFFLGTCSGVVDLLWVRVELQALLQLLARLSGCPHHTSFPMAAGPPAGVRLSLSTAARAAETPGVLALLAKC